MAAEFVALKLAEAVISQTIQRITDLLIHEATSLRGVCGDIENLKNELKWIQSFLKDADRKQQQDERIRIWLAEVRDVACEIEDAIETYVSKVHFSYIKAFHLRKLRAHINSIKDKLKNISDRAQRYQIEFRSGDQVGSSLMRNWRRTYPDEDEDDVITLKSTMTDLKEQLMKEEDRLCVVSIVGMGGLGKTTLAKKVYNDADVKKSFDCFAWIFISQQYVAREVLTEILMQVGFQSDRQKRTSEKGKYTKEFLEERKSNREILKGMDDHELSMLLKNELNEKRYLIVLDDIWRINAWNSIKNAFPKGKLGSKVVFTTRVKEVALFADPYSSPIEPSRLTPTQSWELLKRKAFPKEIFGNSDCPSEFEEQGMKMVAACGGLPLAVVVLGGLLRTKTSLDEWKDVQKDVKSRINKLKSEQQYRVEDILDLSFQELPYYLKPCFLYLATFPEDSEIVKKRLIRLWIAEGFIQNTEREDAEGLLMEDIGEQYLDGLIDRCMVEVDKKDHTGKRVKTCRLHDLMRDFCLSKAKDEDFLSIMQQNRANMVIGSCCSVQSRRIAMHIVNDGLQKHTQGQVVQVHPHLRSLLCFALRTFPNLSVGQKNFQLLRVLELDFVTRPKVPFSVGSLIHLRYLRISSNRDFKLPHSVGNLQNLQTLDLRDCKVGLDHPTLSRLRNLRHLLLPYFYSRSFWAIGSMFEKNNLTKLVTLKWIRARDLIRHNSVIPLISIQVLKIKKLKSHDVTLVLKSLGSHSQLGRLRSLSMFMRRAQCFPKMELLSACHILSNLGLAGKLPDGNLSYLPESLSKLHLDESVLNQEKMEALEKLPNLKILKLSSTETMVKWLCSVGGFPKLEILILWRLRGLVEWEVEEGAMPNLKRLDIDSLLRLRRIPEGLKHITMLRELNIKYMSAEFVERVRRVNEDGTEGEDYYKVSHVPTITFFHTYKYYMDERGILRIGFD